MSETNVTKEDTRREQWDRRMNMQLTCERAQVRPLLANFTQTPLHEAVQRKYVLDVREDAAIVRHRFL